MRFNRRMDSLKEMRICGDCIFCSKKFGGLTLSNNIRWCTFQFVETRFNSSASRCKDFAINTGEDYESKKEKEN